MPPRWHTTSGMIARGRLWLVVAGSLTVACHALLDIDEIEFGDPTGAGATTSNGGDGGSTASGGAAGDAGAPVGGGGAGGSGGSGCVLGSWEAPAILADINSTASDSDPAVSADQLTIYLSSDRVGTVGGDDIWYATRSSVGESFGAVQNLTELNTAAEEDDVEISLDGLTIYWASTQAGGAGLHDIYYATRSSVGDPFGAAQNMTELNSTMSDRDPALSQDGLTIFFSSNRSGGTGAHDLWYATRHSTAEPFDAPVNAPAVNAAESDENPGFSPDGLTLYFSSTRPGGAGTADIWYATRPSVSSPFGAPENLTAVNSTSTDADPTVSADGLTMYFGSSRSGGLGGDDLYTTTRSCL